jgi:hypothetical protein
MATVLEFRPSALSPFLGRWQLNPLPSAAAEKYIPDPALLETLRQLGSMEEVRGHLSDRPVLAAALSALEENAQDFFLEITPHAVTVSFGSGETVLPVLAVRSEGDAAILRLGDRGGTVEYVLELQDGWLMKTEQREGAEPVTLSYFREA